MLRIVLRLRVLIASTLLVVCVPVVAVADTLATPIRDSMDSARKGAILHVQPGANSAAPRNRHTTLSVLIGAGVGFTAGSLIAYHGQDTDLREGDLIRWGLGFAAIGGGIGFLVSRIP